MTGGIKLVVSMLVWNEFLNDYRVRKEAETLQINGYSVVVHALHTPGVTLPYQVLSSGVSVKRVLRSPFWQLRRKWFIKKRSNNQASDSSVQIPQVSATQKSRLADIKQWFKLASRVFTHIGLVYSVWSSKPTVVHVHDVNMLLTGWLAAKLCRARLVYDAHEISTSREGYKAVKKVVWIIERWLMPKAEFSITTTDFRARYFEKAYKVTRPIVLQNRPVLNRPQSTNYLRERFSIASTYKVVIYQGGLQQGRGLPLLVEAMARVQGAVLVMVGGGRQEGLLKQIVIELGLDHKVFFIPTVALEELPKITASADIGIQPIENTCLNHLSTDSNKLLEYIGAGLAVIGTHKL